MTALEFPISYPNSRLCSVLHCIPLEPVRQWLAPVGLHPVALGARWGLMSLTWFEHHDSSLGSYRELGVGVFVSTRRSAVATLLGALRGHGDGLGTWMLALPVTSEVARAAGVQLAALPKTLNEVHLDWSSDRLSASLWDGGAPILSMDVALGRGLPIPVHRLCMYSRSQNQIIETTLKCRSRATVSVLAQATMTTPNPSHGLLQPWAKWIARRRPVAVVWGHLLNGSILAPRSITADSGC
jgi:hypothetical protein